MTPEQYDKLVAMLYATQTLMCAVAKQTDARALLADFRSEGKRLQDALLNTATPDAQLERIRTELGRIEKWIWE